MELQQYDELTFENIKHIDENGVEFGTLGTYKRPLSIQNGETFF